jgi:kynurenine formamidase
MSKYIRLSYILDKATPSYGNRDSFSYVPTSSIKNGDSANTSSWTFTCNHIGTHIDVPFHFSDKGKKTYEIPIEEFIFDKVYLAEVPIDVGCLIAPEHLSCLVDIPKDIELLIIRTGYEHYRCDEKYWKNGPGFDPTIPSYLRANFPNLRCVGFDFISISSWVFRDQGRLAHKEFLAPEDGGRYILAIEDMFLSEVKRPIDSVVVAPIFCVDGNGGPVTVYAKYKDNEK